MHDDAIRQIVTQFGGGTLAERSALADLLIARKDFLAKLYPDVLPKISEARQLAVETARHEIRAVLTDLDNDILAAVKGIASRAKAGGALTDKDLARAATALSRYQALLATDHALFDASLDTVKAHYRPWLDRLQTAIEAGVGGPATWQADALFSGLKSAVEINPAKVKPAFAPFLFGDRALFSAKAVKQTLQDVERFFGKTDYLSKATVPRRTADADAFDKMPPEYKRALWSWTPSHIYTQVNRELLREAKDGIKAAAEVKEYQRLLNDAIKNAPAIRQYKGLSTRGMFNDRSEAKEFYERMKALKKTGGVYQMETFGSSTVGDVPGFSGKDVWLHIQGKTGAHINSISEHAGSENEVLFGTEHRFRVTNYYEDDGKYHVDQEEL